ncbi:NUDIX hydrolase [Edaphobacter sp. 12200R-103]|jgi:ADP-ribose pyrophosphatase|nr:NUDIX hydrolase [Edaphobacter sp. 12200R-103]
MAPQKTSAKKSRLSRTSSVLRKAKPAASKPASARRSGKSKLLSSKEVYKGKVFSVFRDEVIEPGGAKNIREVIRHNGSVVILAVDESVNPADPHIILERQYRHATGQFLLELPAGRVEPGEATLAAAKREMIEETGYRARRWTLLTKYFASPGFLGEWMQIYLARDIRGGVAQPEEDEQIEVIRIPLSQALSLASQNKIHDGKTLIGLMLYDRLRQQNLLK